MICPECQKNACRRSRRHGVIDAVCLFFGLRPWRCLACHRRFYAWATPVRYALYVHCARCGNLSPDRFPAKSLERNKLLARWGVPAYRCDPCRNRFLSLRPMARPMKNPRPMNGHGEATPAISAENTHHED
jgi:hypothetical protein